MNAPCSYEHPHRVDLFPRGHETLVKCDEYAEQVDERVLNAHT